MNPTPREDLEHVLRWTRWDSLRGMRLFLTGGTGFFGRWLLDSLAHANDALGLSASAVVLTRDPERFLARAPHLAGREDVGFLRGDVRDFAWPEGRFTHVIHAATEAATVRQIVEEPLDTVDTIVAGTRRVLGFAVARGVARMLLTSSGAVYGRQPPELEAMPETYRGAPDHADPRAAYAEGKRFAEYLCRLYARTRSLGVSIARCFAFVGPHLPLDAHFAVGNFLRDAARGGPILIGGDGSPRRSYLHAADLTVWLWTLLADGPAGEPVNVGSGEAVSIEELARRVARCGRRECEVRVGKPRDPAYPPERYVPDVGRARELGLAVRIGLDDGLGRTMNWIQEGSHRCG